MPKHAGLLKFKSKRSPFQNAMAALILSLMTWFFASILPTQWFAATVHYDRGLGEPLWIAGKTAFYFPLDWVRWGWRLGDYAPLKSQVKQMLIYGYVSAAIGIFSALAYVFWLARRNDGMEDLHGSAHWATLKEVDVTGFISSPRQQADGAMVGSIILDKNGEVISPTHPKFHNRYVPDMEKHVERVNGKWVLRFRVHQKRDKYNRPLQKKNAQIIKKVEYLRDDNPAHILAYAPTRSGKGVGLVLPTLLTWRHSVLVNDIKGENYALTAGFRQMVGHKIIKFEPACLNDSTAKWNPLDEIRIFTERDVQDAQNVMNMVCDPKGEGLEDHWAKTSWEFLTGLALHLVYEGKTASLNGMAAYLGDPRWDEEKQMYTTMLHTEHDPAGKAGWKDTEGNPTKIHPVVANAAKTMLNKEDKERGSVLSTAKSFLSLYLDPIVARNTSSSDFLVRDLMNSDTPVACYFIVEPGDLERMVSLSRLFYSMVIRRNATDMEFEGGTSVASYKHRLLLLIDELPSLKKLSVLQEGLGYIAGYGLKCYLICQDLIQLEDAYGDKQTIVAGCHVQIGYAPNTQETADKLAAKTGKTTISEEKESTSYKRWGIDAGNVSVSVDKTERELFTSAEFLSLSPEDMVLYVAGSPPVYGRKIKYYEDRVMLARAQIPAPKKSDVLRLKPLVESAENVAVNSAKNEVKKLDDPKRDAWQKKLASSVSEAAIQNGHFSAAVATQPDPLENKKTSIYAGKNIVITEEEKQAILTIAETSGVVERIAQMTVF